MNNRVTVTCTETINNSWQAKATCPLTPSAPGHAGNITHYPTYSVSVTKPSVMGRDSPKYLLAQQNLKEKQKNQAGKTNPPNKKRQITKKGHYL